MELGRRPYEDGDYEFVYELKKLCYRPYVEALWGWNEADQRARFRSFMEAGAGAEMILLLDGERPVGMVNWEEGDEGSWDLCNICLLPEYRGRGMGGALLKELIAGCGHRVVKLQVFQNNPAIHLYRRLGFQVTGEARGHYQMRLERREGDESHE